MQIRGGRSTKQHGTLSRGYGSKKRDGQSGRPCQGQVASPSTGAQGQRMKLYWPSIDISPCRSLFSKS